MISLGEAAPMATESALVPTPYVVKRFVCENVDTFTLTLAPSSGGDALRFAPGQFNMLYGFPAGDVPISVSGPTWRKDVLIHTIRAVGPVTKTLAQLRRGDSLLLRGPFGVPWPVDAAQHHDVLLVAGGIGLAPLRPVLYHVLKHRRRYRSLTVLYGARTPGDILFRQEIAKWQARTDMRCEVTVDRSAADWHGHVGVVTQLLEPLELDPLRTCAMVCGPEVMMHFTRLALSQRGVPSSQIYLSMERNMKCGVGSCGHCQLGPFFICKDGPVFEYPRIASVLSVKEL
jgi:NAD(P)H-flavin reductase